MECQQSVSSLTTFSNSYSSTHTKKFQFSACQYKGVVPQPNGRWGAQLYEGNKRVWIGTFDRREVAARAYDTAVIRFRGPHAATNFSICHYSVLQLEFLASLSKPRVIDMLRTNTYHDELARFMRARCAKNRRRRLGQEEPMEEDMMSQDSSREWVFEKVVTPSDVGKLNRLVIPKQYAKRYLPVITADEDVGGIMLRFEDEKREKIWRFKYCYWKSSQNYVLTKGWGEFVKDRGLRCGDVVRFYTSMGADKRFYIDTISKASAKLINDNGSASSKMLRLFGVDIVCPMVSATAC
ncbi:AP2/ERF and B3 domain-containing transcription factor RAV1-like [Beta vulgaris subsp. vulgaris]|uniref:AP2/ERF and B3 domain-containing transcription factor RAV1-like n=1 Tax=Beta vulgaris subsp. vulgaris TaxID=3555 RepID=UPI00203707F2|nr:AP2/ERF and B3 domain-containing transcription factor RAV1-like [Beta vulgaris subsp. vulgaris]